jgi:hypothetical protein
MALGAELVAVGLGDLLDDTVSPEQTELASDLGGAAADVGGRRGVGRRGEEAAEVAIAEAGGGELAPGHGREEREVGGVADAEGANAPAVVEGGARDLIEEAVEGGAVVDGGEGVEVPLVGPLGEVGAAVKVGDAFAEWAPRPAAGGIVLEGAEDAEVGDVGQGGFDAQDAGAVVHLDRVAVDPVLDADAFGPVFEAGAGV